MILKAVSCCLEDENVTFLLEDDQVKTLALSAIQNTLPNVSKEELENHFLAMCNPSVTLRCTARGGVITTAEFVAQ